MKMFIWESMFDKLTKFSSHLNRKIFFSTPLKLSNNILIAPCRRNVEIEAEKEFLSELFWKEHQTVVRLSSTAVP